jgi:hypothetical protein
LIEQKTYNQYPSTTTRVNISDIDGSTTVAGVEYGKITLAVINYPLANEDTATLKISNIDIDYESMTGTQDCEYSISPSLSSPIIGNFSGSFNRIIE